MPLGGGQNACMENKNVALGGGLKFFAHSTFLFSVIDCSRPDLFELVVGLIYLNVTHIFFSELLNWNRFHWGLLK